MSAKVARTRLMRMSSAPADGWESLIGTYWVCAADGKTLRHTTERQSQIKVTMKSREDTDAHFEDVRAEVDASESSAT